MPGSTRKFQTGAENRLATPILRRNSANFWVPGPWNRSEARHSLTSGPERTPMRDHEILRQNRRVYETMAAAQDPLCKPATDEELADPLGTVDGAGWLGGSIAGWRVLCLAAGGGRQSSLYAAAGADVTVVDLSGAMLELDRRVAAQRGYSVQLFEASMEDLSMLGEAEFDLVIHPVSTCYIPNVRVVFGQVARVTRPGGLYISQHKQPTSLQCTATRQGDESYQVLHTYYRDQPVPPPNTTSATSRRLREPGAIEFLHRWEELIGGMCLAGFVVEDLREPMHAKPDATSGSFADRARYVAPYVRIKARRRGRSEQSLWLPDG